MTRKELYELKDNAEVQKKIAEANRCIFKNLKDKGFSIVETRMLISSMDKTLTDMTRVDPLRKLSDFPSR